MSYSPTVYCASMVTPNAFARLAESLRRRRIVLPPSASASRTRGARTDSDRSTRRAAAPIRIQVIDERLLADVDLLAREECRYGNDHGEFLRLALEVVRHGHHGAIAVANQHDLRRLVEQLRIRLRHVETAEAEDRRRRPGDDRHQRDTKQRSSHNLLLLRGIANDACRAEVRAFSAQPSALTAAHLATRLKATRRAGAGIDVDRGDVHA